MADVEAMTVPADVGLDAAVEALPSSKGGWVPVLEDDMTVVGIISNRELVRGWHLALSQSAFRLAGAVNTTGLADTVLEPDTPADGVRIRDLRLPTGTVVVSVTRGDVMIAPDGDLELQAGDKVTLVTRADDRAGVLQLFRSSPVVKGRASEEGPAGPVEPLGRAR